MSCLKLRSSFTLILGIYLLNIGLIAILLSLLAKIVHAYQKAIVAPGEMVGMIAASIGEPTTQ